MDDCLAFAVYGSNEVFRVEGALLLNLLHNETTGFLDKLSESAPVKLNGDNGFKLASYEDWLGVFAYLRKNATNYLNGKKQTLVFEIAGRAIQKLEEGPIEGGGKSDGFYMRDLGMIKVADKLPKSLQSPQGPAYREFGSYFWDVTSQASTPKGYAMLTDTASKLIRGILSGSSKEGFDDGAALAFPLLAAVMFLAEPGRNPRAFPIAHMVLDLLGEPYHFSYGGKGAFTADTRGGEKVGNIPNQGPAKIGGRLTLDVALANQSRIGAPTIKDDPNALKEGEFSPTPTGGAAAGRESKLGVGNVDKLRDLLQKAQAADKDVVNVPEVLRKEQNILVRWLATRIDKARPKEIVVFALPSAGNDDLIDASQAKLGALKARRDLESMISELIRTRLKSSDPM